MVSTSSALCPHHRVTGSFVDAFAGRYYRIAHCDRLPPFFMNVVTSSDLWLFLASNGGLTAGRIDAAHALFPYETVDRLYDAAGTTGPFSILRVSTGRGFTLWEPLAAYAGHRTDVTRSIYKSMEGDRVWFEETHHKLQLVFRYGWATADAVGLVRQCELENLANRSVSVRIVDGLRNLLPPGIPYGLQRESSCLVDAYKTAEVLPGTSLAVYALAAGITDRATPMEALQASIVWSAGLPRADVLLSDRQLSAFREGRRVEAEVSRRGVRCVYAVAATLTLRPRTVRRWLMAADFGVSQAGTVARRRALAGGGLAAAALSAVDSTTQSLRALVGAADGLQAGGHETTTAHQFANVLFNLMRGGVFADGYRIPGPDFATFVRLRNRPVARRHAAFLASLPSTQPRATFLADITRRGDRDLGRLAVEFLPLTFSRRHGDPSRPWNRFSIRLRDEHGAPVLNYEGNWRDIFQNWEALCLSFPEFLESVIARFLGASTVDGYNPYRVSHAGIEWEVPDPVNPWASIGYWGDHQVVYLLRLIEWSGRFHPGRLHGWMRRPLFSYAAVPYRILDYAAIRRNPRVSIEFDATRHHRIERLVAQMGTDARFLLDPRRRVRHGNLTEKLLILILTRLTNFVPGGGIWMNTQRPEWNDANNALAGFGVSLVTLCHLRRLLVVCQDDLLPALGSEPVSVSGAVRRLLTAVFAALDRYRQVPGRRVIADRERRALVDLLADAGTVYRNRVYREGLGGPVPVRSSLLFRLVRLALAFIDHTIRLNRREDGLYHAYNLLEFTERPKGLRLHRLGPMLEGQVAVLSSGLLHPNEALDLMRSLRRSSLYHAGQRSYLLYPDRTTPRFLERNVIPAALVRSTPLLSALRDAGDRRLLIRDADGRYRFHPDLINQAALADRLQVLAVEPRWADAVRTGGSRIRDVYERVFEHRAYTGRSGSMFGYEGLGCIYWHMVAKLLLAVQENLQHALDTASPAAGGLVAAYYEIRAGLGFNKSPAAYGAFPTDPYSHTPSHSGAQQPGMTGQVKEELLARFAELGVRIGGGRIQFSPVFLRPTEFTATAGEFTYMDHAGHRATIVLPAHALAFTVCGIPVVYHRSPGARRLRVTMTDRSRRVFSGDRLDSAASDMIFQRTGAVARIDVDLGRSRPAVKLPAP